MTSGPGESARKILAAWEPYRPSNGTEGEMFFEAWCCNCARDAAARNDNFEKGCSIIAKSLFYDLGHPLYPKEWIRQANDDSWPGTARCTAFTPLEELSRRAERAWVTRRRKRDEASAELFTGGPHEHEQG